MNRSICGLLLCLALFAEPSVAVDPTVFHPGNGPRIPAQGGRDVLWSQPGLLGGNKVTSEIINMYGLVSEVAGDFVLDCDGPVTITAMTWWGGQWGWIIGDPICTEFNLIFYEEDPDPTACKPIGEPISIYVDVTPQQTDIDEDHGDFDINFRYDMPMEIVLNGGVRYWFVAQASDHPFPGQWGRTEAIDAQGCPSQFRSEFFGYPDWTSVEEVIQMPYPDASLEIAGYCGGVVVRESSWGRIRGLYR